MKHRKGFALTITLLFVLLLTLFGFSLLLLAGSYYASTRNLFEKENARLACEQAIRLMVDRHNIAGTGPRFFHDPGIWDGANRMTPFAWNDHEITAWLDQPWNPATSNILHVSARRGPFAAARSVSIRQRSLADFALYAEGQSSLRGPALLDGLVLARGGLLLDGGDIRFREPVQGTVEPGNGASFRRQTLQALEYPVLPDHLPAAYLREEARLRGLQVAPLHSKFWRGSRYELRVDLLSIDPLSGDRWRLTYDGAWLGDVALPLLWFDSQLAVLQVTAIPVFAPPKTSVPLYIAAAGDITLLSDVRPLETSALRHPLALVSEDAVYVDGSAPRALRIEAFVAALGSDPVEEEAKGLILETGGTWISAEDEAEFHREVLASSFLLEDAQKMAILEALTGGGRIVWFCGGLALSAPPAVPEFPVQVHFHSSREFYPLIPPLPFVYVVEGSAAWQ